MLPRILSLLLLACSFAYGNALTQGMSVEEVQVELGRAESTMAIGDKEVLIYADGTRLEFIDGKLVKENEQALPSREKPPVSKAEADDPLIKAEEIVQQREGRTIGASVQPKSVDLSGMSESYESSNTLESLEAAINAEQATIDPANAGPQRNLLQKIAITFGIEIVVTFVILSIAFQISGFPSVFRQILVLSLAVALAGALLDTLLRMDPLNPIRSAAGLLILILLIRPLTDVREWATAIKIAIIARLVSIAVIWLAMIGLTVLFSM